MWLVKESFLASFPDEAKSHRLKCCSVGLKTALEKFIGLITDVSNIFFNINNSDVIIALMIKVLYRIQQRLTCFNNGVF